MDTRFDPALSDAEGFRRVWQRVQGSDDPAPPLFPGAPPPPRPEKPPRKPPHPAPKPPEAPPRPAPPEPPPPPKPGPEREAAFLRKAMEQTDCRRRALGSWQSFRHLAAGSAEQLRRLSAALFLLTGERYRPGKTRCPKRPRTPEEAGRQLYFSFRSAEEGYRRAEGETKNPALSGLFRELAGECRMAREQVRRALERMM